MKLIQDYFIKNAKESNWMFNEDFLTDCPPTELAMRVLKSKLLENLADELPYKITPVLDFWDTDDSGELFSISSKQVQLITIADITNI